MTEQTQQPSSGLYAFSECEAVDMQNGAVLLIDKNSSAQLMVAAPVAQSMMMCRSFRTLEQHSQVLTSSIPELQGQQADVMNVLTMLRDAGLLVTAESACARLNADTQPVANLAPTRVFAITCDRPAAVERLLESMLHGGNLGRHDALILIDDSRDPANASRNREAVENFSITSPRDMIYFGADEARQFMQDLITALPEKEDAIRFLIDREHWAEKKTYGLARNLSLLLSIGYRAIVLDDDVICAAVGAPHKRDGLQFGQREREADFYRDQSEMLARTRRTSFDPLSGHAACLGLNMSQAIDVLNGGRKLQAADLNGANSAYLSQWDAGSKVLITQTGTMGDPGTPGTEWLLTLDPASTRRLTNFDGGIEGALASRCYWLGHAQPVFTKMSVISQVSGLDNSELLPPYMPVFRGEDYLFGAMTEYLHPHAAVLEYDWAVPHMPLEQRTGNPSPEPASAKGKLNINKYVTDHTVYAPGISSGTRLQALTALLRQLAESSEQSLTTLYRREVAEAQAGELAKMGSLLNDGTIRSPAWQSWLQQSAATIQASSQQPAQLSDIPAIPSTYTSAQILQEFRSFVADFAGALAAWEDIRSAAQTVSAGVLRN